MGLVRGPKRWFLFIFLKLVTRIASANVTYYTFHKLKQILISFFTVKDLIKHRSVASTIRAAQDYNMSIHCFYCFLS